MRYCLFVRHDSKDCRHRDKNKGNDWQKCKCVKLLSLLFTAHNHRKKCSFYTLMCPLESVRLAGTTTKTPTKRHVRVAGRSSPRSCNWSGRPVRSIPITKIDDNFLRRSSCGDHSPRLDSRIRDLLRPTVTVPTGGMRCRRVVSCCPRVGQANSPTGTSKKGSISPYALTLPEPNRGLICGNSLGSTATKGRCILSRAKTGIASTIPRVQLGSHLLRLPRRVRRAHPLC
jgi:hypothetical protein